MDAKGSAIDLAKIETLHREDREAAGKLGFTVAGSGTLDDPRLEAHATLDGLALGGEPLGRITSPHTANRSAIYTATTKAGRRGS